MHILLSIILEVFGRWLSIMEPGHDTPHHQTHHQLTQPRAKDRIPVFWWIRQLWYDYERWTVYIHAARTAHLHLRAILYYYNLYPLVYNAMSSSGVIGGVQSRVYSNSTRSSWITLYLMRLYGNPSTQLDKDVDHGSAPESVGYLINSFMRVALARSTTS